MDQEATLNDSNTPFLEAGTATEVEMKPATWNDYVQLAKPGIIKSNLLTTFTGLWIAAQGAPGILLTIYTLIGSALVIGSGAVLNNYWDRELDMKMKRTQDRALASGKIHPRNALIYGIILLLAGLAILTVGANLMAAVLGLLGHIFYVMIYTPMKRVTTLNTVIGGISGAIPPMIGWAAYTSNLELGAWVLFLILFFWQPPHFLALAMLKVEEYRAGGIPMLPVVRGFDETKRQMFLWAAALVPASLLFFFYGIGSSLYLGTALVLGLVYLYLLFQGFSTKDDIKWAKKLFAYSLIYLTVMCAVMIISYI